MRVLDKVADMGGLKSDTTFLPSGKGWESELEIFRELETINKPTYQKVYKVEDSMEDTKSNRKMPNSFRRLEALMAFFSPSSKSDLFATD